MRTTLTIDDELFARAVALAERGIEQSELVRECPRAPAIRTQDSIVTNRLKTLNQT